MTKRKQLGRVALMSIETGGEMVHIRRYEIAPRGKPTCTHEGAYTPQSVTPHGVLRYLERAPQQDRRAA